MSTPIPLKTRLTREQASTMARNHARMETAAGRPSTYTQALAAVAVMAGYANVHEMTADYLPSASSNADALVEAARTLVTDCFARTGLPASDVLARILGHTDREALLVGVAAGILADGGIKDSALAWDISVDFEAPDGLRLTCWGQNIEMPVARALPEIAGKLGVPVHRVAVERLGIDTHAFSAMTGVGKDAKPTGEPILGQIDRSGSIPSEDLEAFAKTIHRLVEETASEPKMFARMTIIDEVPPLMSNDTASELHTINFFDELQPFGEDPHPDDALRTDPNAHPASRGIALFLTRMSSARLLPYVVVAPNPDEVARAIASDFRGVHGRIDVRTLDQLLSDEAAVAAFAAPAADGPLCVLVVSADTDPKTLPLKKPFMINLS